MIRDLLALTAPPVPEWFEPVTTEDEPTEEDMRVSFLAQKNAASVEYDPFADESVPEPPARTDIAPEEAREFEVFCAEKRATHASNVEWTRKYSTQQRMARWPYFYADMVMEERKVGLGQNG